MKKIILFLTIFLTSCQSTLETKNFIIVFVDDMGYGDTASYGHPTIKTPNLDIMANEGQKWTQFYSASSVCTPSRAALLTGRLPIRNGMIGKEQRVLFPDSDFGLPSKEITIAEKLRENGYKTAAIGKWHLGHKEKYLPINHGFDYYYGIPYSNDMNTINGVTCCPGNNYWQQYDSENINSNNYNVPIIENKEIIERPADQRTITKRFTDKTIDFIDKNKSDNFLVYLAHSMPHTPLFASKDFYGKSKSGLYGDVIEEIDYSMGRIMKKLIDENLHKNTLVVFTSDNGPWLPFDTHGGSAGPLRDGKGTTWEGGQRVPGLFWGGTIKKGSISDLGSTMDLFPTLLDFAGIKIPDDRIIDGISLKNTLINHEPHKRKSILFYREREIYAARLNEYKAHFITEGAYDYGVSKYYDAKDYIKKNQKKILKKPLLFNLNKDVSEKYNIAEDYPEIIDKIKFMIDNHKRNLNAPPDLLSKRTSQEF